MRVNSIIKRLRVRCLLFLIMYFMHISHGFALEQNEKLWLGVNGQLAIHEKWQALIFTQSRFINKSHPWQSFLIEGAIGYQLAIDKSIWFGYRWTGHHPNDRFYQENRLFQQFIWQIKPNQLQRYITRSRFEEIERSNQNQIAVRFRERLALEWASPFLYEKLLPYFYDEVFFQFNKTNYTSNKLITENRLFIGFNLYQTKTTWWELGYINQYLMRNPSEAENQMNHILSVNYNFL